MKILDILFCGIVLRGVPKSLLWTPLIWLIGGTPYMLDSLGYNPIYDLGKLAYWAIAGTIVGIGGFIYAIYRSYND